MAALDRSIFRERAIEKYRQRRELNVILRLVSPPMFMFLWMLLLLAVCAGVLVWSIQEPILVQGKGLVVQQKVNNKQRVIVLLLLPPAQQANLKVGQPVSITINSTNTTFNSSIETIEDGVMSPAAISTQVNLQIPLAPTISGPSVVAIAPVEPMSLAPTYVGSQCQVQVEIGSQSALSLVPGFNDIAKFFNNTNIPKIFNGVVQNLNALLKR
jgi:hypothetical protein